MVDRTRTAGASLANTAATGFGAVVLLVGILGFIPGITQMNNGQNDYLLGLFAVNGVHNLVHILTGVVALAAGLSHRVDYARAFFLAFGIVYALVTIIGFIQGNSVLGLFPVNGWDNALHVAITLFSLAMYFASAGSVNDRFRAAADSTMAR